jgi:hypothetical protein
MLGMQMKMGFGGVPRVSHLSEPLSQRDLLPRPHQHAPFPQMGEYDDDPVARQQDVVPQQMLGSMTGTGMSGSPFSRR